MKIRTVEMAEALSVSRQRVIQWENEGCSEQTAKKIASFLRVDVEDLGLGTLDKKEISDKIAWVMAERGMTLNQFAFDLKIPRCSLKRWLIGARPHKRFIEKIAASVGMTADEFLTGNFDK